VAWRSRFDTRRNVFGLVVRQRRRKTATLVESSADCSSPISFPPRGHVLGFVLRHWREGDPTARRSKVATATFIIPLCRLQNLRFRRRGPTGLRDPRAAARGPRCTFSISAVGPDAGRPLLGGLGATAPAGSYFSIHAPRLSSSRLTTAASTSARVKEVWAPHRGARPPGRRG